MEPITWGRRCWEEQRPEGRREEPRVALEMEGRERGCVGAKHREAKVSRVSHRLTHCSLTAEGCIGLAWVLDTPETLTELELSFNLLLDLGVERLCNGLKEPGCRLHRLR